MFFFEPDSGRIHCFHEIVEVLLILEQPIYSQSHHIRIKSAALFRHYRMWKTCRPGTAVHLLRRAVGRRPSDLHQSGFLQTQSRSTTVLVPWKIFAAGGLRMALQTRRGFTTCQRLLQQQAPKTYFTLPEPTKKPLKLWKVSILLFFVAYFGPIAFTLAVVTVPLPFDLSYRYIEFIFDRDAADWQDFSFWGVVDGREPGVVFFESVRSPTAFVVVQREEMPDATSTHLDAMEELSSSDEDVLQPANVLTLRPVEWIETPGGRMGKNKNKGDPYERYARRGPWGVEIETPNGAIKCYRALKVHPEDVKGDLNIQVPQDPACADLVGQYLNRLRSGDRVLVQGPRRGDSKKKAPR